MKKFMFLLFILLYSTTYAQIGNWYVGYKTGYAQLKNMNALIDRYNTTRSFLDKEMPSIHFLDGPTFGYRIDAEIFQLGIGWTGRNKVRKAGGVDNSGYYNERYYKIRYNTLDLQFNFILTESFGVGLSLDFGNMKAFSRTVSEVEDKSEIDYELLDKERMLGSNFYVILNPGNGPLEFTLFMNVPIQGFNFRHSGYSLDAANFDDFEYEDFKTYPFIMGFGVFLII
jgi:hypothetical protein